MASDIKRLAVIFGQETFRIPGVEDRKGNEHDVKELESTLKKLGFSVRQYNNLNKQEILSVLTSISLEGIKNLECILVTVLTHGNSGGVLLAKDREFYTKDVWELFRDSEKFNDIPKIFIFQACRGSNEEEIFSFQSPKQGPQNCVASQTVPMLPHKPGFLLIHSTIADHVSKRNHETGTIFIQTLCNELSAAHDQNGEINFLSLLTEVNNKVTTAAERDSGSQTSTFTSFLREPLILKTKNAVVVQKSAPATSKVSNDAERGSIRKAYEDVGTRLILILYTEKYQDKLLKLKLVLNRSHFTIQPILVKDIEVLNGLSRCTDFKKVGSLTVIVLAEICGLEVTGYCEQLYVKFSKFDVQLSAVWSEFTVSRCYELMGKPKLFYFCDLLDRTDHPEEMSIVNVGSVNNHSDFIWTYCFGERMFEELTYALCNPVGEITHLLTTAMRKSDSMSRTGGRISHFESTLRFQFYYRSLQQEMASLQLQEKLLPKEIESHMKLKSSVGIPIEPVAYSSKYPDNTRTRDGQHGYEPQNASIIRKSDQSNEMEQTQQLVSSPASLDERKTFKVNPRICSHQELNETSNSTYKRSQEQPEIFERYRQGQGIESVFEENMEKLLKHLIANVKPTKMLSQEANGEQLLPIMKKYFEYISKCELPKPKSLLQLQMELLQKKVETKCLSTYNDLMRDGTNDELLNKTEMDELHKQCADTAIAVFDTLADFENGEEIKTSKSKFLQFLEQNEYKLFKKSMEERVESKILISFEMSKNAFNTTLDDITRKSSNIANLKRVATKLRDEKINDFREKTRFGDADRIENFIEPLKQEKVEEKSRSFYNRLMLDGTDGELLNKKKMHDLHTEYVNSIISEFDTEAGFENEEQIKTSKSKVLKSIEENEYKNFRTTMETKVESELLRISDRSKKSFENVLNNQLENSKLIKNLKKVALEHQEKEIKYFIEKTKFGDTDRIKELHETLKQDTEKIYKEHGVKLLKEHLIQNWFASLYL